MPRNPLFTLTLLIGLKAGTGAVADCDTVVMADTGWTDVTATTAVAAEVLRALGYGTVIERMSVPVTYTALAEGSVEVFLGNWMPTLEADIAPYRAARLVDTVGPNLTGAKYTLATNAAGAAAGLAGFDGIAALGPALGFRLHGGAPGSEANRVLDLMIAEDAFGLSGFSVVAASEALMLAEVGRATQAGEPVVFLAWEPHPMNLALEITYLDGGDAWFGPDFGGATVYTNTSAGFATACPNLGRFLGNLRFPMRMVNEVMAGLLVEGADPAEVARAWLRANPARIAGWLDGVTTRDGGNAEVAVIRAFAQ